ncbi:MAG: alpha-amylase [Candidatus Delongbacteria bacterium]|nr:alpha-amylase [Candidatus Delongbacteria bacterium]
MKISTAGDMNVWWKHGIIYHIYVPSFQDSNKDGFGDLRGIINRLDHLKDLGIKALWLSPVFKSPMADFGYDVEDYCSVDPVFGSMEDFDELLNSAHKIGMKIIIDMVMNHTSEKHPWFIESRSSGANPKRDWYIWAKGKNGKPPNNWMTVFGKPAWEFDKTTGEYYYHSFLKEQPDLNWRNPEVKEEFFRIFRFWLEKGVDGFRLDAVNFIVKDKKLRRNPTILELIFGKRKFYSRNRSTSVKLLQEFRSLVNSYDERMLVGEIFALPPGESNIVSYYLSSGQDTLDMAFDFSLLFQRWSAAGYYNAIERSYGGIPAGGWPCIVLSNHDLSRSYDKQKNCPRAHEKAKIRAVLQLTLKGTPFIYYGEEIGMKNGKIPKDRIKDPLGKIYWPLYKGRDGARTPMQWDDSDFAGFSSVEPWLPVNAGYERCNVMFQKPNEYSLLNFYTKLTKIRNSISALSRGDWVPVSKGKNGLLSYLRSYNGEYLLIVLNFLNKENRINFQDANEFRLIISTTGRKISGFIQLKDFEVRPLEGLIFKVR